MFHHCYLFSVQGYGGQRIARPKKQKRKERGGGGDNRGRGRGLTIEHTEEPSPGRQESREDTTSSSEEGESDLSSSDEGVPSAAFSDAKESLSPTGPSSGGGGDFQLASADFAQQEQSVSSYHEGGYDLPSMHTPLNGGMEHVTSPDSGVSTTEYGKTP